MKKTATALLIGSTLVALAACSGGSSEVKGLRDDVKTKAAVIERSHYELKKKTKTECTRRVKGVCKSSRTVPDGVKRVKVVDRPGQPALYCVELDDVNGSKSDDDAWYTVNLVDFTKAAAMNEGTKIKFTPKHSGCWR